MEIKKLVSIANKLDNLGLTKEADILDSFLEKVAEDSGGENYVPAYSRIMGGGDFVAQEAIRKRLQEIKAPTLSGEPAEPRRFLYHGPPEPNFPAGKPYYAAKPTTINQFKDFLSAILKEAGYDYKLLQNGKWDIRADQIKDAFQKFADLAGSPEAGKNWKDWSINNNYAPSMQGILDFWAKNVDKVYITHIAPKVIEEIRAENLKQLKALKPRTPSTVDSGQQTMVAPPETNKRIEDMTPEEREEAKKRAESIKKNGYFGYKITNNSSLVFSINKIMFYSSVDGTQKVTAMVNQADPTKPTILDPGSSESRTVGSRGTRIAKLKLNISFGHHAARTNSRDKTSVSLVTDSGIKDVRGNLTTPELDAEALFDSVMSGSDDGRKIIDVKITDDLLKEMIAKNINKKSNQIIVGRDSASRQDFGAVSKENIRFS